MLLQSVSTYLRKLKHDGSVISGKPDMASLAEQFVNGELRESIEMAFDEAELKDTELSVNEPLPIDAYGKVREFIVECNKILNPLGYTASESHDGAGMHSTLFVEWKV